MAKSNLPLKLPSPIYPPLPPPPEITNSDLLPQKNCQVQFIPQMAKSNLPSNGQVWFTPQIAQSNLPPPPNHQVQFTPTPEIAKSDLPLTSPSPIYPPSPHHNFWAHFSHSNIMLCFTKVFSVKDQWV